MLEENGAIMEYSVEARLETALDCVDELDRLINLVTGLRHMCMEVIDCAPELKRNAMVRQAYADVLYREMAYVIHRANMVSEVLYSDVQRRGRLRCIVRRRKERSRDKRQISPA